MFSKQSKPNSRGGRAELEETTAWDSTCLSPYKLLSQHCSGHINNSARVGLSLLLGSKYFPILAPLQVRWLKTWEGVRFPGGRSREHRVENTILKNASEKGQKAEAD